MATYVLLHGAGSDAWYWHLVAPQLEAAGHRVVAPDLPTADPVATLDDYADVVVDAVRTTVGEVDDLVLVAQSLAGFVAPLVCERLPVRLLILVSAMVPMPGESAGDWWANTAQAEARRTLDEHEGRSPDAEFDPLVVFLHDVPGPVVEASGAHAGPQGEGVFVAPLTIYGWPAVPTRVLVGRHDRFFPLEFQRRVVLERLGFAADVIDTGHLPALARPDELVARLENYRWDAGL